MVPTARLALQIDAADPTRLAAFYSALLDRPVAGTTVVAPEAGGVDLVVVDDPHPKLAQGRIHLDLTTASDSDRSRLLARALSLGARPADVGQGPDADDIVLADPEGNELCLIDPGSRFLAGTGRLGAVNCDGTAALGRFWSDVLEWPLVWDQDEQTAIQAPRGGPKITWSGPPLMPVVGRDRFRLLLRPPTPDDVVAPLQAAGATEVSPGRWLDVDGNEVVVEHE